MFSSSKFEIDLYLCWIRLLYSCNTYLFFVIILVKFNAHSLVMSPLEALASKHCPRLSLLYEFSDYRKHIPMHRRNEHDCLSTFHFIFINWLHVWCLYDKLFCLFCQNLVVLSFRDLILQKMAFVLHSP